MCYDVQIDLNFLVKKKNNNKKCLWLNCIILIFYLKIDTHSIQSFCVIGGTFYLFVVIF